MSSAKAGAKRRGLPQKVRMRASNHFVDELATRSDVPVGKLVSISSVEPDPEQPRTTMGDLSELADSIRAKGVLEPILVRRIGDAPKLRIISGERRYRASMQAGLVEIPVIEMEVGDDEALEIALIENLQRKDLTPFEEAEGYKALADRFEYTHEKISEAVGKSRTVVTESLSLLSLPARAREAAQALGITTKSVLLEILKCETEEEMIALLESVAQHGLNRDDLRKMKRGETNKDGTPRRKPFVFAFKAPDKSFSFKLRFRQSEVSKSEMVEALEKILADLRTQEA